MLCAISEAKERNRAWLFHNKEKSRMILRMVMAVVTAMRVGNYCVPSTVLRCSVAKSCPTLCDPRELHHARLPCPSLSPGICSNSCPLSWWCHPIISSSVALFFSCPQSFPASGSFPVSQLFTPGGQSIGASASASVFTMNIQGWFPFKSMINNIAIINNNNKC